MSDIQVGGRLRRVGVDKHYGPGPHPGTGTSQDIHGEGKRYSGKVLEHAKKFRRGEGTVEDIATILAEAGIRYPSDTFLTEVAEILGIPKFAMDRMVTSIVASDPEDVANQFNLYFVKYKNPITYSRAFDPDFKDDRAIGQVFKLSPDEEWGDGNRPLVIKDRLAEFEDQHAEAEIEHAIIMNLDGEVEVDISGKKDQIEFAEDTEMESRIMVHNHPSGSPPSPEDITVAALHGARETIIVGPEYRYMARFGPDMQAGPESIWPEFARVANKAYSEINRMFKEEVRQGNLSAWHAGYNDYHELWLSMERKYGANFDYTRQRRGHAGTR